MTIKSGSFSTRYDRDTYLKAVDAITQDLGAVSVTTQDPLAIVLKFMDRMIKGDPKGALTCEDAYACYELWSHSLSVEPIPHHAFRDNLNHFIDERCQDRVMRATEDGDDIYIGLSL